MGHGTIDCHISLQRGTFTFFGTGSLVSESCIDHKITHCQQPITFLKYTTIILSLQKAVFSSFCPYWGWTQNDGGSEEPSDH
jgi:hypothetical protein